MHRTTIVEEYFEIGDLVRYQGEIYEVIGVEEKTYSTDDLTHMTQRVLLEGMTRTVDAAEIERISPEDYIPF